MLLVGLLAAVFAALAALPSPARAAGRRTPTLAPSDTVVDGPSAAIVSLDGLSVARDGTGGLVYLKDINGVSHVFVSVLAGGSFQAPVQVDQGLPQASTQPVIAAGNGGILMVAFINGGVLYAVQEPATGAAWQAPTPLFAGAANPSLSMSNFGKAYVAFTAGGASVRTAYYYNGVWGVESSPLNANPGDIAGVGTNAPQVVTAGDGTAIVAWGEANHIYTRRVVGTSPSVVYEQVDPSSMGGWSEVSADDPQISAGGDSSYAAVAFDEVLQSGGQKQTRVLVNHLQASQVDGAVVADGQGVPGAESSDQPRIALQEYGGGFVTAEGEQSHNVFATTIGNNAFPGATAQLNSAYEQAMPYAVPATAGTVSTLIAWQQDPGADGPEIRVRYAPDGSDLGPEEVVSSPNLGPTDAELGLYAGGDLSGDAAIAWVQGSGAQTQIVTAQLFQAPGGMTPSALFHYVTTVNPVLSWSGASEVWGSPVYTVKVGGVVVGQTTATALQVPLPLTQGRHVWQVTATNLAGLTNISQTSTVFVDTIAPHVTLKITGQRRVGSLLRASVNYTDAPHGLPHSEASGVNSVEIKWGDGTTALITHRASHIYKRRRTYTVTVTAIDRAGNQTVVTRKLKITLAAPKTKRRRRHR